MKVLDTNDLQAATCMHNHSISESSRDQLASIQQRLSWTNVTRQCFLLGTDPASTKFGITSLTMRVQWVSWRRMTSALVLWAMCSNTLTLLAVVLSMFSWSTTGCKYFAKCPEKVQIDRFLFLYFFLLSFFFFIFH